MADLTSPGGFPATDAELLTYYPRSPGLRASFVTSLDGGSQVDGLSTGLSSVDDKRVLKLLRMVCDVVLVGAGTLRDEQYRPITLDADRRAWRRTQGLAEYPRLVVVTASLRIAPDLPALARAPVRPLILTTTDSDHDLDPVADVRRVSGVTEAVAALRADGADHVLCEGGPRLFGALAAEDLVDELCLTLAPLLSGPGAGRITAGAAHSARRMALAHCLRSADGSLMLRYVRP